MIKKVILISILIVLIGIVSFFLFANQKTQIQNDTLSERSKEFLEEKKNDNQSDWRFARLDKGTDKAGSFKNQRQEIGNCFSFVIVFRVHNPRKDGDCNWYFGIEKPRGFITSYMVDAKGIATPDQIDGVSMRQKMTDKYKESKQTIKGVNYLIFHGTSGNYEANVFALINGKALTFNLITTNSDNFDKELQSMLDSMEFD